jgi:hypothetical protein
MPRCVFGDGPYQCPKRGIGDPPLCLEHYELLQEAEYDEDDPDAEPDLFQDLLDRFLGHPSIRSRIDRVVEAIGDPSRFHPNYQGPGQAYAAEAPPRPNRPQHPPPHPPPRQPPLSLEDPRQILHFSPDQALTVDQVRKRQRQLARLAHPDLGGSKEAMLRINDAADRLISQLR